MVALERDDRYIPTINGGKDGINLSDLNDKFRQLYSSIMALEGRQGTIQLQNDVEVLGGITAESLTLAGVSLASPVVGKWEDLTGTAGTGAYVLTNTLIANTDYFALASGGQSVSLLQDGLYLILGQAAATADGSGDLTVDLIYDGTTVSRVLQTGFGAADPSSATLVVVIEGLANKSISMSLVTGTNRVGDVNGRTHLTIYKLN